jgi:hypothetical protein
MEAYGKNGLHSRCYFLLQTFTLAMDVDVPLHPEQFELLDDLGIEEIVVNVHIDRARRSNHHVVGEVELTYVSNNKEELLSEIRNRGYDDPGIFIYEENESKMEDVALEEGPRLEEASYSAYMADKAESDYYV